ncbi:serpin family protein [Bifidobacterium dentium]|uniref:serpin family protein n=1 Tax=Bifidobacterium dentium TaxID=1689 RepID=UPI0007941217|nr:serpin family protein [Bifidobacterium dentium]KXS24502.1 MAG: serine proteinase inhibitor [Bifidobacterium dentium]MCK6132091.1 serpin family protein [Bifidobacterium dentium]QTL78469.1 serpin family protein [Bifidobacterium dentium]HBJ52458.1 serpin family protein [Bifidobacterium dentium]
MKRIDLKGTTIVTPKSAQRNKAGRRVIIAIIAAVLAIAIVVTGGFWYFAWGGRYTVADLFRPKAVAASDAAVESSRSFAYESAVKFLAKQKNVNYSPASLQMALLVAAQGAKGDTLSQLQQALASEKLSDSDLTSIYRSIIGKRSGKSRLDAANSIWARRDLTLNKDYTDAVRRIFGTQVKRVKAFDNDTNKAMSTWISDQTRGMLKPEIDTPKNNGMSILNTLYADGRWSDPFDKASTKKSTFHTLQGSTSTIDFMHKTFETEQHADDVDAYTKGDGWQRVDLTFDNGGRMKILLPDNNTRFKALRGDTAALRKAFSAKSNAQSDTEVNVSLPRFSIDSTFDSDSMIKAMQEMGVTDAFNVDKADFSGMSDAQMFIGAIVQGTRIEVTEAGAKAAAYTQIDMELAMMPVETVDFNVDRPFLYEFDSPDGLPLFIGAVTEL